MNPAEWIALISLVVSFLSALYARHAWTSARQAILQQTLASLHAEYSSADMLDAVKSLWDFYRTNGPKNLVAKYENRRTADDRQLLAKKGVNRIEFIKTTLHYKRRFVSQFYAYVLHLLRNKIISEDVFYASWTKADLEIIKQILVPLEQRVAMAFNAGEPSIMLKELYDRAK